MLIMKTKTEQLNSLFDEWVEKVPEYKNKFIRDGIINEQLYNSASKKILFIAKEPNDPKQEEAWDFREWWNKGLKYAFSYRIAEWSYGLLNNFPEYDEIWNKNNLAHEAIQYIAFMNIKKSGGTGNSEFNNMIEHIKQNISFIHRQIEIIEPEIIITGTSWNELRDELFPNLGWLKSGYDIDISKFKKSKVIDFYHPSSRTPPAASYSLLQNIVGSQAFLAL
jgi:hypothetical protein